MSKTMKKMLKNIIKGSTVILMSWIVVYGIVYAQQEGCSATIDACIPTFSRISDSCIIDNTCRTLPPLQCNRRLQPIHIYENFLANCDEKNTCCKTDRCERYYQCTYINPLFPQYLHPLQKNVGFFHVNDREQSTFEAYILSTSLKAVPIYILTQSILI